MTEPISVVGAVIRRGDAVLLAQRRSDQAEPLRWELPGGKCAPGEEPPAALVRELREELGIETEVGGLFQVVEHDYPDRCIYLMAFLTTIRAGEPRPLDCQAVRWVPIRLLGDYDICEADLPVVKRLQAQGGPTRL
ncbi:MAG: (deoxy)nucleoside triphosphate pyrophosphohydrolase [Candidatus Sericytochromatia bacterium]|nr:(deoxy)nucleoside triphosphate pyrophosphohydrolase [Candidatus Tanganyikabacteria bacterium]